MVCGSGPYSTPADYETRLSRTKAHREFDPIWESGLFSSRRAAYRWLAEVLGIPEDDCHFGRFDSSQCEEAVWHIRSLLGITW